MQFTCMWLKNDRQHQNVIQLPKMYVRTVYWTSIPIEVYQKLNICSI